MPSTGIYPNSIITARNSDRLRVKLPNGVSCDASKGNECRQNKCIVFVDKNGKAIAYGSKDNVEGVRRNKEFYRGYPAQKKVEPKVKILFEDTPNDGRFWVGGDRIEPTLIGSFFPSLISSLTSPLEWRHDVYYIYEITDSYNRGTINLQSRGQASNLWDFGVAVIWLGNIGDPYSFSHLHLRGSFTLDQTWDNSGGHSGGFFYYPIYEQNHWWQLLKSDQPTNEYPGDGGGGST